MDRRARALNDSGIIACNGNKAENIVRSYCQIERSAALNAGFILPLASARSLLSRQSLGAQRVTIHSGPA